MRVSLFMLVLSALGVPVLGVDNLVTNGDFESGSTGWRMWSRQSGALKTALDTTTFHYGQTALRLEHKSQEDWSLQPNLRVPGQPGDLIEVECWVKVQGSGVATLCASTWNAQGKAEAWS